MTTELETAMASLRSALPDDETDHGHVVIESDAIRSVLAALSTPPADDVREALDHLDVMNESGRIAYADYVALHDMVSRIEVRPRGTVTAPADAVRDALIDSLSHVDDSTDPLTLAARVRAALEGRADWEAVEA